MFRNDKLEIDCKQMDDDDVFEHAELQDKFLHEKKGTTALPGLTEDYNAAKYKEPEAQMTDLRTRK